MNAILAWLRRQIQTVPPEIAVCEFRCARHQCSIAEAERCDLRLSFDPAILTSTEHQIRREA